MPKIVKGSKIPGYLRFTNNANDQHMVDLMAMQKLVDEDSNLPVDKIRYYVDQMNEEFFKRRKEYTSNFVLGGVLTYYSNPNVHTGPRTDRDQLELFEDVQ
ncbi:MAG: hypothetical protein H8E55_49210 [Pelagibacterales bacterium]|nr:hypothetical protein [Pelagibacterales bacterium]